MEGYIFGVLQGFLCEKGHEHLQWEIKIHTAYFKYLFFFHSMANICCLVVCTTIRSLMSVIVSGQNLKESLTFPVELSLLILCINTHFFCVSIPFL